MKNCRVLIADDHRDSANSLAMLLRMWGHDVSVAYDGDEAVRLCGEFKPHLAVLDVTMPRKNGYEVAEYIRVIGGCVTVMMSGHGSDDYRMKAKEVGVEHFLLKPADAKYLERLIQGICENQKVKSA